MEIIIILGILLLLFALFYLIYHFVRKILKKEPIFSKKRFYSSLLTGIILLITGSLMYDNSNVRLLQESEAANKKLAAQITELETDISTLADKVTSLEDERTKLGAKSKKLEEQITSANTEKDSLTNKMKELEDEIVRLTEENKTIAAERDSLNDEVASLNDAVNFSSAISEDSSSVVASDASSGNEYYDNCTAAKAAGAAPVRDGDPGYGRHLDRDGDGVGCEY